MSSNRRSSTRKSYLKTSREKQEAQKDRQANVKDSLLKFLDTCDTEDLLMGAAVSPRKRINPLSASEHTGVGPKTPNLGGSFSSKSNNRRNRAHASSSSLVKSSSSTSRSIAKSEHGTSASRPEKRISSKDFGFLNGDNDDRDSDKGSFALGDDDKDDDSSVSLSQPSSPFSSPRHHKQRTPPPRSRSSSSNRVPLRSQSERGTVQKNSRRKSREPSRRTRSEGRLTGALDRKLAQSNSGGSSRRRGLDDNASVGSSRSAVSAMSRRSSASAPAIDAGPFNAFFNGDSTPSRSRQRDSSGASVASSAEDEKFLAQRKSRQDEILCDAMTERWKQESSPQIKDRNEESSSKFGNDGDGDGDFPNDDDDQPMVKGKSKNPFRQLQRGLTKTAQTTKNAAKGSVNVVKNPKRTVKNIGGFAKDVGKETMKLALDPTLAAKTAGNLGKKGIGRTYKVTKNVTTGVAKGGVGLTKTVAKTGLNATTMVAGTVVDGAGKVVKGANGLIFKGDKELTGDGYDDYDAKNLRSRRKTNMSLFDRLGSSERSKPPKEVSRKNKSNSLQASSLLIPMTTTSGKSGSSWDV
jgi:hypothetical protein